MKLIRTLDRRKSGNLRHHLFQSGSTLFSALIIASCVAPLPGHNIGESPIQTTESRRATPSKATIAGRLASKNTNVFGAQAEIENTPYQTIADASGAFSLSDVPLLTGQHLVASATAPDGTHYSLRTPVQAADTSRLDLASLLLTQSGSIYGTVKAEGLSDLLGTNVFIAGTPMGALTDSEGNYFLANVPVGTYTVTALRDGYQPVQGSVTVESGKPVQLSLSLTTKLASPEALGSISGTVHSGTGPVAGVSLSVADEGYAALSDQAGQYRLSNLPAGDYTLRITREGFTFQELKLSLGAGETLSKDSHLRSDGSAPPGRLEGTLTDASGKPIPHATIETRPPTRSVTSDENGHFVIPDVLPGSYYLTGSIDGQVKASRFLGVAPSQSVKTTVQGPVISGDNNQACAQQNINNVNINIPGAEVTVVIDNKNTCTVQGGQQP